MTAGIVAAAADTQKLVSIPLSALTKKDEQSIVWTVDRTAGTVHSRPVEVADFTNDGVRIAQGLKPGDVVVAAGTQFMTEGLKVKLGSDATQQSADAGNTQLVR